MIRRGRLDAEAAARLLWAAALLDAVVVFLLLETLGAVLAAGVAATMPGLWSAAQFRDAEVARAAGLVFGVIGFGVLLLVYWTVCELLLGGRSLGRACLMLELRSRGGGRPTARQIMRRAAGKILSLGTGGLSMRRPARYDAATDLVWYSPLAPGRLSATRGWRIEILSGHYGGKSHTLERLAGYDAQGVIRIGRDPSWCDIVLDREERVSGRHAVIRQKGGRWQILDYGGGRGSSNHTFLAGAQLPKGTWTAFDPPTDFAVADVRMRLARG